MTSRLFIGIPVLNRLDLLRNCLERIDYPSDLTVVNNNSHDFSFDRQLGELAQEFGLTVHRPGRNMGVAASWNWLVRTALERGHELAVIGSNDTFLEPGSLAAFANLPKDDNVAVWHLSNWDFFAIGRRSMERVGWFDENFYPAYKEDQDFAYRCELAGLKRIPVPSASAATVGSATLKSSRAYQLRNATSHHLNTLYYHRKWGGDFKQELFRRPFNAPDRDHRWWPDPENSIYERDWDRSSCVETQSIGPPITGVILARNEEANILPCIQALRPHVDDLLLVDMDSTDRTVLLARPHVAKVLSHPRVANFDAARNVAIPEAAHEWLWFVDADERISEQAGALVSRFVRERGHDFEALTIPFKTYFCGQWMRHCGWWPGYTMPRLLKRGHFLFAEKLHGGVEVRGRQARIQPDPQLAIDHYSYQSLDHYLEKLNRYTSTEALNLDAVGRSYDWQVGVRAMVRDLHHYYEVNRGYADGHRGWILSWLSGQYRWLTWAKLAERQDFSNDSPPLPTDLDAVIELMEDELAQLRRRMPELPLGIVWRSPLWDKSGYATESRMFAKALAAGERPLMAQDLRWTSEVCELPPEDRSLLLALTRARRPRSTLAIANCIPTHCRPDPRATLNVLRTTFETDRIPAEWKELLENYDEIWVCSEANARAFRRGWIPPERIRVVPSCLDTRLFRPLGTKLDLPSAVRDRFVFLSVFDWQLRKGWDVLVEAYVRAFQAADGAALLLKITRSHGHTLETVEGQLSQLLERLGTSATDRPDVVVCERDYGDEEMAALYRSCDAFVLASRGEGWGRPYMEAMACGLPTIGTVAGGNVDFMTEANSLLIPTAEVEVPEVAANEIPVYLGHRWREPDGPALQRAMRRVFEDIDVRKQLAVRGAQDIAQNFSLTQGRLRLEAAIETLEARLLPTPHEPSENRVRVELEGEIGAGHSFSIVNEHLCRQFAVDKRLAVSVRRVGSDQPLDRTLPDAPLLTAMIDRRLPADAQVTIRHAFPPNWQPPRTGKWVHIQPWEFSRLPAAWVEPLRTRVDEIWAPSQYVRRVYEASGVPAEKIYTIPWGIDAEVFSPDAPPLVLPTDKQFRFLFVGGTIPRKGFDLLLQAFREEFTREDDVCLVVKDMGANGFYRGLCMTEAVRQLRRDPRSPEVLYYDQFLSAGQLASLYTACNCLVHPYRGEGFGLPILEAMACGIPPIVPQGGPSDDFVTADSGYLLPAKEVPVDHEWRLTGDAAELEVSVADLRAAIRGAFEEPEKARSKGQRGSSRVRSEFTWTRTAQQMRDRILALVSSESPQPTHAVSQEGVSSNCDARATVSLCMIARDSANTIGAALDSIRPWVDELIVVDTGSMDDTPEIARRCGAKVFRFDWCDDFSAARNESLRHATGDWVLWMDTDDTIDQANGQKLRTLADGPHDPATAGYVMQVHCPGPGEEAASDVTVVDHVKLFRNSPDLRFDGRIHEQILPAIRAMGGNVKWTDIFVVHSGYDHSPEGQDRKRQRDLRILHRELEERPGHPFTLFNLGMTCVDIGQYQAGVDYLRQSIHNASPEQSHVRKAYALWVYALRQLGELQQALTVCQEGLANYPQDAELRFRLGVVLHELGRTADACTAYRAVLESDEPLHFGSIDQGIRGFKARQNLASALTDLGDLSAAEAEWRAVVNEMPDYVPGWRGLAGILHRQSKLNELHALTLRLDRRPKLRNEALLIRADLCEARGDLPGAIARLRQAAARASDDVEILRRLGRLLFEHGTLDDTADLLQRLLAIVPDDPAALHNLGSVRLQQSRPGDALALFERSLAARPDSAETRRLLEMAEAQLNNKESGDVDQSAGDVDGGSAVVNPDEAAATA